MLTPSPKMSPSFTITSPTLMPMRNSMRRSSGIGVVGFGERTLNLDGACTASSTLANSASTLSPGGAGDPPAMVGDASSMMRRCAESVASVCSSSASISRL